MIRARRLFLPLALVTCLTLSGCSDQDQSDDSPIASAPSASSDDVLDLGISAHGGMGNWKSYGLLEYDLVQGDKREHHIVDMHNRKVLVQGDDYTIGHDGDNAWVFTSNSEYSGRPRFYSSLYFYFFGIPFVLADPGTKRDALEPRVSDGATYDRVKISYEPEIGDSPDDYYIAHFDSQTHRLEYVMYTVTYRSQEPSDNFNAQRYVKWQSVDGLLVPAQMDAYYWDEDVDAFGDKRGETVFENVSFSTTSPDQSVFNVPEGAVLDPKIEH